MPAKLYGTPGSYFTAGFGGSGTSPLDLGSYALPQAVDPANQPCIILVVNYEAAGAGFGPYTGVLGMTYGGVPMTISEAPRVYSPTPYGDTHSSFIAILPFDGSTVFADNHFRFIAGPTLTFLGVNGAFAGVATGVDPAFVFDQLVLTNPLTGNAPITLTMPAITGDNGDLLIGFVGEGVGTTGNAWVTSSSPTFQIENGPIGSENVCAFYRELTTTETSGLTVVSGTDTTPYVGAFGGWLFRLKGTPAPTCDPDFNDVVLLLHFDGTNGSTTFIDSSLVGNTVSAAGNAVLETATVLAGTASVSLPDTSTGPGTKWWTPVTPGGPLDILPAGDFTVEIWTYLIGGSSNINGSIGVPFPYSAFGLDIGIGSGSGGTCFLQPQPIGPISLGGTGITQMVPNAWNYVAFARHGNDVSLWANGFLIGTAHNWNPAAWGITPAGAEIQFGQVGGGSGGSQPVYQDEVRITNGVARFTPGDAFIPVPAVPFPSTACTISVPNVIGDSLSVGEAAIIAAGLVVGTVTTGTGGPAAQIYAQSPVGGTIVTPGSSVDITYNPGVVVPNLYNMSPAAAILLLTSLGLALNPTYAYQPDSIVIAGNIDAQVPVAGTVVTLGTAISVTISTGPGGAIVPDIIGLSEAAAIAAILAQGLIVGTIDSRVNPVIAAGLVGYQSPEGGDHVMPGSIVSFSLSLGANVEPPYKLVQTDFTWQETVISQYANSATILQLVANMDAYVNPAANIQAFYDFVWNVDTAQGFGLDIWGKIVNVSRLLHIPNSDRTVGFQDGSSTGPGPGWDVEPFGGAPGDPVGGQGIWNQGPGSTQTYILPDIAYRRLIFVKALANIVATTVPALNQLLRNLFAGRGNVYVTNGLDMTMVIVFADFDPTPVELAIIEQSGAFPIPPGVSFTITAP